MIAKTARGTISLIAAQIVFLAGGYVIHIVLARHFGPEIYGIYGGVISFLAWVEIAVIAGIPTAVQKYVAEGNYPVKIIEKKGVRMQIVYSGALFALVVLLSPLIATLLREKQLSVYIRIVSIDILIYAVYFVYLGVVNGMRDFGRAALVSIIYSLSKVSAVLGLVFLGFSLAGALIGNIIASFCGLLAVMLFCKSYNVKPLISRNDDFQSAKIIKFAIPIILLFLTRQLLMSLDLFCVKALIKDVSQTGFYVSAAAFAKFPYFIFMGLTAALFPSLIKSLAKGSKELTTSYIKQALRFFFVFAIPFVFVIMATSENLISLAFSPVYLPAASILNILVIGLTFFALFMVLSTIMIADEKPHWIFLLTLPLLAIDFLLNLIFIPSYGTEGAAWATTITAIMGAAAAAWMVFNRFKTLVNFISLLRIFLSSLIIFVIARFYQAPNIFLVLEYAILLLFYIGILILLGEIKMKDLRLVMFWRMK